MAVVDMQRMGVLLMQRDQQRLLHLLQKAGCVQFVPVEEPQQETSLADSQQLARNEEELGRIRWAIGRLAKFDSQKASMFKPLPAISGAELHQVDLPAVFEVVNTLEHYEQQSGELRGHQTRLAQTEEQLKPWLELELPASQLVDTAATKVWTGFAPSRRLQEMMLDWQDRPAVFRLLSNQRDASYFYAVVHRSQAEDFQSALRSIGYQHAAPLASRQTPKDQLAQLQKEQETLQAEHNLLQEKTSQLAVHLPQLRLAFEALSAQHKRLDAQRAMAHTGSTSLLSGWVPKPLAENLQKEIETQFPGAQVSLRDPIEGEEPPVLLHNHKVVSPYEAVISGFALPAPTALDPTAVMMPFFACFFGMMVSDAGYGLVMAILVPILIKLMQPSQGARRIFWIIAGGGLATLVWGALYNTWFGFGPWPSVFDPVNNSLPVMGVCIGIGALHLFTGLMLGAVQNFRKGQPWSALFDQFSWMLLIIGLGLLLLPQTSVIGKWMAIAGAAIIVVTAGREKSNNPIKRLISGLGALYGVTGWISDLLSYMRLFGMGLATGVIGMVINQLVGMIMGGGIIGYVIGAVVFVGAHLFNAAINILGAYVHACRLQYIEFFGKFYEEGGKPFKPLRLEPRYLRIIE